MPTEMMIDTGVSIDMTDEHAFARLRKYRKRPTAYILSEAIFDGLIQGLGGKLIYGILHIDNL